MQIEDQTAGNASFNVHYKDQQQQDLELLLAPELQSAAKPSNISSERESSAINSVGLESTAKPLPYNFALTELLTPEILKNGGLEAAILLLMQERGAMFEGTLTGRLNHSQISHDRLLEQSKDRLESMREAAREMDKAKKSGKVSETFGWVGLAAAGVATFLTAGAASPLIVGASMGVLAVTAGLQIDSATGGKLARAIAGESEKDQMIFSIVTGALLMAVSVGIAAYATFGGVASAASKAGKAGSTAANAGKAGGAASSSADDLANSQRGLSGFFAKRFSSEGDPVELNRLMNNGDHWSQQLASTASASLQIANNVAGLRGSYASFKSTELSAMSLKMRAIERRLSAHMDYIAQVVEDVLGQIQGGNRVLAKQLTLAFDPKEAIVANI